MNPTWKFGFWSPGFGAQNLKLIKKKIEKIKNMHPTWKFGFWSPGFPREGGNQNPTFLLEPPRRLRAAFFWFYFDFKLLQVWQSDFPAAPGAGGASLSLLVEEQRPEGNPEEAPRYPAAKKPPNLKFWESRAALFPSRDKPEKFQGEEGKREKKEKLKIGVTQADFSLI